MVATNENDILQRFWKSGAYEKSSTSSSSEKESQTSSTPSTSTQTQVVEGSSDGSQSQSKPKTSLTGSTDSGGVKATLSPAMDILVSSNFERLLWYLASEAQGDDKQNPEKVGEQLAKWMKDLKENGRFQVGEKELQLARRDFLAERVSDEEVSFRNKIASPS